MRTYMAVPFSRITTLYSITLGHMKASTNHKAPPVLRLLAYPRNIFPTRGLKYFLFWGGQKLKLQCTSKMSNSRAKIHEHQPPLVFLS